MPWRRWAAAVGLLLCSSAAWAQAPASSGFPDPAGSRHVTAKPASRSQLTLQPVARFGEAAVVPASERDEDSRPGWQLRWRKPAAASAPVAAAAALPASPASPADAEPSRILQAAFQATAPPEEPLSLPKTLADPPADPPAEADGDEMYANPFDRLPPPAGEPAPPEPASPNDRGEAGQPPARAGGDAGGAPTDLLGPPENARRPAPPAGDDDRSGAGGLRGLSRNSQNIYSCEDIRKRLRERTIQQVSLDISPSFRPGVTDETQYERERRRFEEKQAIREWRSVDGVIMATGRLRDLAYEKVVIDAEYGGVEQLPIDRLSEADLAYISENWGLPQECRIERVAYQPRQWMPAQLTWKASGLCHKPLYFEEVNLERYGHTAGPFAQPVISSAHFFFNIAVLPYKAGIHPPTECQYTLGYYRPGSCAPWIVPPVPLSLRGAVTQATVWNFGIGMIP